MAEGRDTRFSTKKEDCEILKEDNYFPWAKRTRAALEQKRWWEAINPGYPLPADDQNDADILTNAQIQRNSDALNFIIQRVSDTYLLELDDVTRAKEAWEILRDAHTDLGAIHLVNIFEEVMQVKKSDKMTMTQFLVEKQWKMKQLEAAGILLQESVQAMIILNGLPRPHYDPLIRSIRRDDALTLKNVKSLLKFEEKQELVDAQKADKEGEARAYTARNVPAQRGRRAHNNNNNWRSSDNPGPRQRQLSGSGGGDFNSSRRQSNGGGPSGSDSRRHDGARSRRQPDGGKPTNQDRRYVCFACNETGHIARDCPKFADKEEKTTTKKSACVRHNSDSSDSEFEGVAARVVSYQCSATSVQKPKA